MSYRPHKRKRATSLKGKCIEYVGDNLHTVFEARVLDLKLREQVLEYLCETPNLVELPDGFLDESWTKLCFGGCVLPAGILSQVGEQCYDLEELDLKQCSGNEMLDVRAFAALCDGCRQLKTVDLVGIMTLKDAQLECMYHLGNSLRRVRLGGNICLSPATIATFLQRAGKNLLELDLAGCQVNDEVVQAVAANCKNLQELSLGYAYTNDGGVAGGGISHFGWALLMRNLKKVNTLRLKRVAGIGKPLLLLIARHLGPKLVSLDITGFKDIKADEMVFLLRGCPNLEYLNVKNCVQLPAEFLETAVTKLLPKLKTLERDRPRFDPTQLKD